MITIYLFFFIFVFGLVIGSFLNALIWRMHVKKNIIERSCCPKCKHILGIKDLIPLFSFFWQKGKCRYCQKKISWQYPIVELVTGIFFIFVFLINFKTVSLGEFQNFQWIQQVHYNFSVLNFQTIFNGFNIFTTNFQFSILTLRDLFFVSVLVIIFVYDLKYGFILDKVTLPAILVGLILNLILGITWQNLILAAGIGGGFFLVQFLISKGRWIGGGDIRMGALMGVFLGWPQILVALFFSYILGAIIGVGLIFLKKKTWKSEIPFGVFLAIGAIISLFFGEQIITSYLSFSF
jgi:prepilin signal peptidase PulO-like enzyme (type II secretory pathway)